MTAKNGTPIPPTKPDGVITTQGNGQTIVAELFFNRSGTETFRDKLLKTDTCRQFALYPRLTVKSRKNRKPCDNSRPDDTFPVRAVFIVKNAVFSQVKSRGKHPKNAPIA